MVCVIKCWLWLRWNGMEVDYLLCRNGSIWMVEVSYGNLCGKFDWFVWLFICVNFIRGFGFIFCVFCFMLIFVVCVCCFMCLWDDGDLGFELMNCGFMGIELCWKFFMVVFLYVMMCWWGWYCGVVWFGLVNIYGVVDYRVMLCWDWRVFIV